jgi:hypothetical protein
MSDKNKLQDTKKKIETLRTRLLDLSAKNPLLNFRHPKNSSLRIINTSQNDIFLYLLREKELVFKPIPNPSSKKLIEYGYLSPGSDAKDSNYLKPKPTVEEWINTMGITISFESINSSKNVGGGHNPLSGLQVALFPDELESKLRNLYRKSESNIQETGSNILYIAFGFLQWTDKTDDTPLHAPIYLMPIRLQKSSYNKTNKTYTYTVRYSGEDITPNISLIEKLRNEMGLELPSIQRTDHDEDPILPLEYLASVSKLVEKVPQWSVKTYSTISLFNFSRLLMYNDLHFSSWPQNQSILHHKIVSSLLNGGLPDIIPTELRISHGQKQLEKIPDLHINYPIIYDADQSQYHAIIDAVDGNDMVIVGPPGTGKSQTITNIIASCMNQRKTVLFIAEKLAALEVVKNRLEQVGLGSFCLELHSHKTQKSKIINDIKERLRTYKTGEKPHKHAQTITLLNNHTSTLSTYADLINSPWKQTGKTIHEIFMSASRYTESIGISPEQLHPNLFNPSKHNFTYAKELVDIYHKSYLRIMSYQELPADFREHPWYGLEKVTIKSFQYHDVLKLLHAWQSSLETLLNLRQEIITDIPFSGNDFVSDASSFEKIHCMMNNVPEPDPIVRLQSLFLLEGKGYLLAEKGLKLYLSIKQQLEDLSQTIHGDALEICQNLNSVESSMDLICQNFKESATIEAVRQVVPSISRLLDNLALLEDDLIIIRKNFQNQSSTIFNTNARGIANLQKFLTILHSLKAEHIPNRHAVFQNRRIDVSIRQFKETQQKIRSLETQIQPFFNLQIIQNLTIDELELMYRNLLSFSLLGVFNKDWRLSRRKLLGLRIKHTIRFKHLLQHLEYVLAYKNAFQFIQEDAGIKNAFGPFYRGSNTDIDTIEQIRSWYILVDETLHTGKTETKLLTELLKTMDDEHYDTLHALCRHSLLQTLQDIDTDYNQIKKILNEKKILEIANNLYTDSAVLTSFRNHLVTAMETVEQLTDSNITTLKALVEKFQKLKTLQKNLRLWKNYDIDRLYFGDSLNLAFNTEADSQAVDTAIATLDYYRCIHELDINQPLRTYLISHQNENTFQKIQEYCLEIQNSLANEKDSYLVFKDFVDLNEQKWFNACGNDFQLVFNRNNKALQDSDHLNFFIEYLQRRHNIINLGFENLANAVETNLIASDKVLDAYYAGLYDKAAKEILFEVPELDEFSGLEYSKIQESFIECDLLLKEQQKGFLRWHIDEKAIIPEGNNGKLVSEKTNLHLLRHECAKTIRFLPIRQLLSRTGPALQAIKPCFLMGPMSVAQYLPPGDFEFDVIIMDEASQIKPEFSLGAIARCKQLIVVGDPKQLPPTNFFEHQSSTPELYDDTSIEASDSILDYAMNIYPSRLLQWHYRSRHESLIAFSNQKFYDNKLTLFPSPFFNSNEYGIVYKKISDGQFIDQRNRGEAVAIIKALEEHLNSHRDESIGIVAMNTIQRLTLERMIDNHSKKHPLFRSQLENNLKGQEPLFVKNLENVQGDERDVIFISLTYGPNSDGVVHQRFGPINSSVGWRRLNVLFSRAKKRMHVFSSLNSTDITYTQDSNLGVQALHDFLYYNESNTLIPHARYNQPPANDFELAMIEAIQSKGYDCIPNIGVAGFFIDVAVVDPADKNSFILGIECDGESYHSVNSIRDRERLRKLVLTNLGWTIHRVWSLDWYRNQHEEVIKIMEIIRKIERIRRVS